MLHKRITYSLPVLKSLVASKTSCVYCVGNCQRCFNTNPAQMGNLKSAVSDHLSSKVTTYDSELQGIIMSYKNIKVVNSVLLSDDGEYRLDYIADIYIFKPSVGDILIGRVNKKSQDHLGVLVHSMFNATLPRPRVEDECPKTWVGTSVKIGEQVTFEVLKVNFMSRLPYIKGKLIEVENRDMEDADSGIGGHESTEESAYKTSPNFSDSEIKKIKVGGQSHGVKLTERAPKGSSLLEIQSSLLSEFSHVRSTDSKSDGINTFSLPDFGNNNMTIKTKKRKRKSSLIEIENSLIQNAFEHLTSSDISNDELKPKTKRKKGSIERPNENPNEVSDSIIQNLINSEMSPPRVKKKKSNVQTPEDIPPENKTSSNLDSSNVSNDDHSTQSEKKKKRKKKSTGQELGEEVSGSSALSEESHTLLMLAEQGDLFGSPMLKKEKKRKKGSIVSDMSGQMGDKEIGICSSSVGRSSAEQSFSEHHLSTSLNDDSFKKPKKKKKSALFQDVDACSTSVSEVWTAEAPHPERKKKSSILLSESEGSFLHKGEVNAVDDSPEKDKKSYSCLDSSMTSNTLDSASGPELTKKKNKLFTSSDQKECLSSSIQQSVLEEDSNEKHKKKKKKSVVLQNIDETLMDTGEMKVLDQEPKKKKKKRLHLNESLHDSNDVPECDVSGAVVEPEQTKKKKNAVVLQNIDETLMDTGESLEQEPRIKKKKKKSKIFQMNASLADLNASGPEYDASSVEMESEQKKKKKKKRHDRKMETP